jgi:solute carrier family 25 phosphate transporter 3
LSITFASGYLAGIICALVSHPADSLVSLLSTPQHQGKSISHIVKEVGFVKLATNGLGPRIVIIGTLTGLQWWIYDSFKTMVGFGTTGGVAEKQRPPQQH